MDESMYTSYLVKSSVWKCLKVEQMLVLSCQEDYPGVRQGGYCRGILAKWKYDVSVPVPGNWSQVPDLARPGW